MAKVVKSNQQYIFLHDAICEGPIEGLVYGDASVYLNDSRLRDINPDSPFNPVSGSITFSGSTGTIATGGALPIQLLGMPENDNFIVLTGGAIAKTNATYSSGVFTITGASSFSATYETKEVESKKIAIVDPTTQTVILIGEGELNGTDLDFTPDGSLSGLEYVGYTGTLNAYNVELVEAVKITTITSATEISTDAAPTIGDATYKYRISGSIAPNAEEQDSDAPAKLDNTTVQFRKGSTFQNPISELNGTASGTPYTANPGSLSTTQLKQIPIATYPDFPVYEENGYPDNEQADGAPVVIGGIALFGSGVAPLLDEIRVSITYGSLVAINKDNGDDLSNTAINLWQIRVKKPGDTSFPTTWQNAFRAGENVGQVFNTATSKSAISFEHYIDLEPFKPFDDFEIRVARISRHLGKGVQTNGANYNDSTGDTDQGNSTGSISGITAINKDKFTYPYTAHAGVFLDSREFSSVPKRSYELRGMKVRVPDGYLPREYSSDGANAEYPSFWNNTLTEELYYTDNPAWVFYDLISNDRFGVGEWITEADVDLFSLYRISKYCDELVDDGTVYNSTSSLVVGNFYKIKTTGGTTWSSVGSLSNSVGTVFRATAENIVGTGIAVGLEPRFRANVFLTKATDVYKVLKDMATIFTSIIYWMDGKMTTILDAPGDPIYNFSKANIIDGAFSYETTGEKTKINQVVVTWNDPEAGYEQRPLVVEDRNSIVSSGRIVKQSAFAFGCTSEGQARRYGKWKLFTAQGQTEIVSFKASLDGAFLKPGDIIQVQDSDRYGTKLSGRISDAQNNAGNSVITLDRPITLNNTATYKLSVLITEPAAFYVGEGSVVVNGSTINRGDRIPSITSEGDATDATDDSSNPIATTWSEHSYVEHLPVSNNQTNVTELTTTGQYSVLPTRSSVWMLTEEEGGSQTVGSADLYRILGVTQDSKNVYSISAVEHYNEKYDFIDNPEEILDIPDDVYPTEPEVILPPSQVYVLQNSNAAKPNEELIVQWDYPEFIDTGVLDQDNNPFLVEATRYLDGFELYHNIPNLESPISVGKRQRKYPFKEVPDGSYIFRVRAVSVSENKSAWASARYLVEDPFKDNVNRINGLQTEGLTTHFPYITNALGNNRGAYDTTGTVSYSSNDVVTDGGNTYSLSGPDTNVGHVSVSADNTANPGTWTLSNTGLLKFNDEGENVVLAPSRFKTDDTVELSTGYQLDCSSIASAGFPGVAGGNPRSAYVVLDHSNSALKIIKADFNTDLNIFYWQDLSVFDPNDANAVWDDLAGTVTVAAKSNKVIGVGTSFTSLNNLNKLKFDNGTIIKGARVAYVESDTVLYLDRNIGTDAFVGASGNLKVQNYAPDFRKDVIIGQVLYNTTNGVYRFKNFMALDPSLVGGRSVFLDSNVAYAQFDLNGDPILLPDSIIVDATATGFENPEFKVTYGGTGDAQFLAEDSSFSTATPNPSKYEKTIYTNTGSNNLSYSAGSSYEITVEVREANDPGNTDKQRSDTFTIFKVDNVAAGGEGAKIVTLELEDYSIVYDADGENPSFNSVSGAAGDITITATASPGFANALFRFTIDGTQGSWVSSADNTSTDTYTVPTDISTWGTNTPSTGGTRVFSVEVAEEPASWVQGVNDPTAEASDSASLLAVQIGQGGLAVVLTNPTHSLTASDSGVVSSNVGSGTTIEVFVGGVGLDYVTTSSPLLGQWTVSNVDDSDDNGTDIVPGTITASGSGPVVASVADHTFSGSNALDDQESITYTITVPQGVGKADLTATAIQTFSLAKGAAASTTASLVFLYAASDTKPVDIGTGFPNVTVDLSTGLISGYTNPSTDTAAVTDWYDSAQGAAAGSSSTDKIWVVAATANGTGSTDDIEFGEWSSPVQFTGVDGFNTATIELYQLDTQNVTAPGDPTQGLTYTFSPPNLSTTGINGWSQSRPEPSRAFPYVWRISAAAVSNTATDTIDTNDWSAGIIVDRFIEDGFTLELTNDAETVGAATLSTPLSGLSLATTAKVFQAGTDITSAWDFSAGADTGITVSQITNTFTVTDLTAGFTQGNVTITAAPKAAPAAYAGSAPRSVNFTVTKVANGADGVSYRINATSAVVSYDSNNPAWTPTSVTFSATKVTPTGSSAFTTGYWKLNGANQGQASSVGTGTISATSGNITAQLYLDSGYTQLVDTESVPIVASGTDGADSNVPGPDGGDGRRQYTFTYYYTVETLSSASAPAAPTITNYTFSSGVIAGSGLAGWSITAPTLSAFNASDQALTWYAVTVVATESLNNGVATGDCDNSPGSGGVIDVGPVQAIQNFDGIVSFTNLSTSNPNATIINGDNITTGAIKSNNYAAPSSGNVGGTGSRFDLTNGIIQTPYFYTSSTGAEFTGSITLASVTDALTFTPYNSTNPDGFIDDYTVTETDVTQYAANLSLTQSQITDLTTDLLAINSTLATKYDSSDEATISGFAPIQSITIDGTLQTGSSITITGNSLTLSQTQIEAAAPNIVTSVTTGGGLTFSSNVLNLDPSLISLSSLDGDYVESVNGNSGVISNIVAGNTTISAGYIELTTGGLAIVDNRATFNPTNSNSIVLDTTGSNNAIKIYDGTTVRVILGKL